MPLHWTAKTPGQVTPYTIDWSSEMDAGDTIKTYAPVLPVGASLVLVSSSASGQQSQVEIGGGIIGTYTVTNTITTMAGETFVMDAEIWVRPE